MIGLYIAAAVFVLLLIMRYISADVYDIIIVHMTKKWYQAVMERMQNSQYILDVGIGTATALLKNKELIETKDLKIVGVDYDQAYINAAKKSVLKEGLQDRIKLHCKSIYDEDLGAVIDTDQPVGAKSKGFDAVYFSGSWSLMPSPVQALRVAGKLCKDEGLIYITQTFQKQPSPVMKVVKPLLKYLTTIDFGKLHLESDLDRYLKEAERDENGIKFTVLEKKYIPGSINNRFQAAHLIVLKKVITCETPSQRR